MRKNFKELKARMSPDSRGRADARTKKMMADMLLGEVRRLVGLTQEDLAKKLGIAQPTLSKLESQDDMQISTLRRLITPERPNEHARGRRTFARRSGDGGRRARIGIGRTARRRRG